MLFEKSLEEGYSKVINKDILRAKSLIKSADEAILSVKELNIKDTNLKTILRELYEGLRQYYEAIGYIQGYKFLSHEVITYFIKEKLEEENLSIIFDHYRKIRNSINYYGKDISKETVEKALKEIPENINRLKKYLKEIK